MIFKNFKSQHKYVFKVSCNPLSYDEPFTYTYICNSSIIL